MIWDHEQQLRQYIDKSSTWPLPYDKWPLELLDKTNCLAFALGLAVDLGKDDLDFGYLISSNPELVKPHFSTVIEKLLTKLNLEWRQISHPYESTSTESIIQIYGFYSMNYYPYYDFHIIRRDLDGTWVHKPGYDFKPEIIDWEKFRKEYPDNEISGIYAVTKKTP